MKDKKKIVLIIILLICNLIIYLLSSSIQCTLFLFILGLVLFLNVSNKRKNKPNLTIEQRISSIPNLKKIEVRYEDLIFEEDTQEIKEENIDKIPIFGIEYEHNRVRPKTKQLASTTVGYFDRRLNKYFYRTIEKDEVTVMFLLSQNSHLTIYYNSKDLDDYFFNVFSESEK